MQNSVTIAFIDDHPIFVDGLCHLFARMPGYEVVASGHCADDALKIAVTVKPAVMLMDLRMPGDSFATIREISDRRLSTKILAFTAMADVNCATRALEMGASGYLLKGATADELAGAVRAVLAGESYITPAFATKVIAALRDANKRNANASVRFNVREAQIITLLLNGATNKEIGTQLSISEKTVRHYMTLLMRKLNVRNRLEVVLMARRGDSEIVEELASLRPAFR